MSKLIKPAGAGALAAAVQKDADRQRGEPLPITEALVLLLDASPSMDDMLPGSGTTRYHVMLEAAQALADASHAMSAIGLAFFADSVNARHGMAPTVLRTALTQTLKRARKDRVPGSGTAFGPALDHGRGLALERQVGLRRLVLLSDGDDNAVELYGHGTAWRSAAHRCADARVIVDTVYVGDVHERGSRGAETLAAIAQITGGVTMLAADAKALRRAFLALEARARGLLPRGKP